MSTHDNLMEAFAEEAQGEHRKYTAYAEKGRAEGSSMRPKLFGAAADAETLHALKAFSAKVVSKVSNTAENKDAVAGEDIQYKDMYPTS